MCKKIASKIGECVHLCLHNDRQQNMHLNIHIYTNVRFLHMIDGFRKHDVTSKTK